jgi:diguanylate cyclase (GGDEF)-like protein
MSQPLEAPRHHRHDAVRLRRTEFQSSILVIGVAIASLIVALGWGERSMAHMALVEAALAGWMVLVSRWTVHGREAASVVLWSAGIFVAIIALLALAPDAATRLALAALVPTFVAARYLTPRQLTAFMAAVWMLSTVLIVFGVPPLAPGSPPTNIGRFGLNVLGWSILVGFVLLLIRRYQLADRGMRHLALHDGLTGVYSRTVFIDRVEHALAQEERAPTRTAVIFLDIDGLKRTNDRHGHERGDELIRTVADRLRTNVRRSDTVARMGGDEFAVLLEGVTDPAQIIVLARRLRGAASQPVRLRGEIDLPVSVSLGLAFSGAGGETAEALLRNADYAMYQAKRDTDRDVVVYNPVARVSEVESDTTRAALRGVHERHELRLQYQPVVRLQDGLGGSAGAPGRAGSIESLEALVRWHDPERGVLLPGKFIALAEESGDIVPLGRWILGEACERLAAWQRSADAPTLCVRVNVSPLQLEDPAFESEVRGIVEATGIEPSSLVLELTEHVLVSKAPLVESVLGRLRGWGIHVAADDFGTGYSSLSYLKDMPIDGLKMDRSFLRDAVGDDAAAKLVKAVMHIGEALDVEIVGEGIETEEQLAMLRAAGCDLGQGFLLARPLDADEAEKVLRAERRPWDALFRPPPTPQAAGGAVLTDADAGTVAPGPEPSPGHALAS